MFRTVAVVIAILALNADPLAAGQQGRSVNPEAIEFDTYPVERLGLTQYRIEFFKATADPQRDSPIKSIDVDAGLQGDDDGTLRVDVHTALAGMPDGEYVARLRAFGENGQIDVRVPNEFFILSRQAGTDLAGADPPDRERFWAKVGLTIIGGILLVSIFWR
jgi:hypothetical protein